MKKQRIYFPSPRMQKSPTKTWRTPSTHLLSTFYTFYKIGYIITRLSMIVRVNVVPNMTVFVDID